MTHGLSVAHLTAITLPPADLIEAAGAAGFDGVGLRLVRVTETTPGYPLMEDRAALRAALAAMRATGVAVRDIEFVKITPETDLAALEPLLDVGAELGAGQLITAPYDPDHARLAAKLGALSERARSRGIDIVLEFFPWTSVPDLTTCWNVVQEAGPAVGILADALHFDRSNSSCSLLAALPSGRLPFAHLCDAPRLSSYDTDELLRTAREARLPPGEGEIDLGSFLDGLHPDTDLALEVPTGRVLDREDAVDVLRSLYRTTADFLSDHRRKAVRTSENDATEGGGLKSGRSMV
ncbi:sugar phosphate isomerase/epimerase family protein [Defluviimonas sp. SAOS-178_SWC]|uniref:sugar phosphate isomerase/epimerase family protein n=1 Tax=Defluviimonas sp. SAOS-178_SWC TaxID=3121287 RepID=UPI00322175EC